VLLKPIFKKDSILLLLSLSIAQFLTLASILKTLGFEITFLSVQKDGLIDLTELEKAFRPDTILVS
jgi:cysteine desulfurase